jgi:hypothetical protein
MDFPRTIASIEVSTMNSPVPNTFVIQSKDGTRLHSGEDCLVELTDLDFFQFKPWRIEEISETLGLIEQDGALWTVLLENDIVQLQIATVNPVQTYDVTLRRAAPPNSLYWLRGDLTFKGRSLVIYVYRVVDDAPTPNSPYVGRLRIEAYDTVGPFKDEIPENQVVLLNRCDLIRTEESGSMMGVSLKQLSGDQQPDPDDQQPVQDDVGNGHEGHR